MQTSKILLAVGATLVLSLSVRGADNDAQAKARQALEQQLNQPAPQPTPSSPQPISPAPRPAKKAPPAPAAPVMTPAEPQPATVLETTPGADEQSIAKAREAMRQKIGELSTEATPAPAPTPPPSVAPAPTAAPSPPAPVAAEPPPKVVPPPPAESPSTLTPGSEPAASPEAIAKARDAVRQKMAELPVPQVEQSAPENPAAIDKARQAMYDKMQQLPPETGPEGSAGKTPMQFPPLEGPELPISGAKVQKLHALLAKYKADQITPEQYQAERAKILAEP